MKKKKITKCVSVLLFITIIINFFATYDAKADTISDGYNTNLNIALTSFGNINNLDFTVNGDYHILNQNIILKKDYTYTVSINAGIFLLKQNGIDIFTTTENFVLKPSSEAYLVKMNGKSYRGGIKFNNISSGSLFLIINNIKIEDYLTGVVPYEMSDSFPMEALKAQAVAARTYALFNKLGQAYDLRDDTYSQVYNGYDEKNINSIAAVEATKGKILTYNGQLIDALFSASNGGYTEVSQNVWSANYPYLESKPDDFDAKDSSYHYFSNITTLTNSDIDSIIKQNLGNHQDWNYKQFIKIDVPNIQYFKSGRISNLPIIFFDNNNETQTKYIGKNEARTFFNFKSAKYTITIDNNSYKFDIKGYGHGLGLSQWGAYYRAKNGGQAYNTILKFYYIGVEIQTISESANIASFNNGYIGDSNRYGTAINIANKAFSPSSTNKMQNVVIATGESFPDALSGSVLAKQYNAPILLVDSKSDSESSVKVTNYISQYMNKAGTIFILGGTGVISSGFEIKFKQLGFNNIVRLGGSERIETSNKINERIQSPANLPIVIATANDFPDALSISPVAADKGWPIFLVDKSMSSYLQNYISSHKPAKVYIAGGSGVVSDNIKNQIKSILGYGDDKVIRLGGQTRYETSRIINSTFIQSSSNLLLSTGKDFPDALAGSVYAAMKHYPIMLADSSEYSNASEYIKFLNSNSGSVALEALGLQGAVDINTINNLTSLKK